MLRANLIEAAFYAAIHNINAKNLSIHENSKYTPMIAMNISVNENNSLNFTNIKIFAVHNFEDKVSIIRTLPNITNFPPNHIGEWHKAETYAEGIIHKIILNQKTKWNKSSNKSE